MFIKMLARCSDICPQLVARFGEGVETFDMGDIVEGGESPPVWDSSLRTQNPRLEAPCYPNTCSRELPDQGYAAPSPSPQGGHPFRLSAPKLPLSDIWSQHRERLLQGDWPKSLGCSGWESWLIIPVGCWEASDRTDILQWRMHWNWPAGRLFHPHPFLHYKALCHLYSLFYHIDCGPSVLIKGINLLLEMFISFIFKSPHQSQSNSF